jgi:hypothetical protein
MALLVIFSLSGNPLSGIHRRYVDIYIYVWLMGRGGIKQIQGFETLCCHGFSRPLLCLDEADFTE